MTDAETRRAILAAAATAPDIPVALVAMRGNWWGCCASLERVRTDRATPFESWRGTTVGRYIELKSRAEKAHLAMLSAMMRQIVRHYNEGNPFAAKEAAFVIDGVMEARNDGADLSFDPEFMSLVSAHMRGDLSRKQGRKVSFGTWGDAPPWYVRNMARAEFAERRASGEMYDALIADYVKLLGVSRSTVESIVSPKK